MCYDIFDGRLHTTCGHFDPMSSSRRDCYRANCAFSSRHDPRCRSAMCAQKLQPPLQNPIRMSPAKCSTCVQRSYSR
ncbi:hypothetical protein EXIGLDRAFT_642022 [Exidia glandulosa HHB12029]|uniref:Uncharacterized protein n=1 Tax=Exidia glandulosa HHB12029 TaxID=1314781 RepID=A0A165LCD4_EXIGL|nr:hypothetical protein EXIGLDRAFT_642022 [Exidia glandulosa HHB12029]